MASKRYRPTASGEPRWAIIFRRGEKQTSETFVDEAKADRFKTLLELKGFQFALDDIGKEVADQAPTVRAYVNTYVNNLSGITEGTRSDYRSYVDRDLGDLGDFPVDLLARDAVQKWVNQLAERLSGKSIRNRQSLLSAAMTAAVREGLRPDNPVKGVRLPRSIRRDMTFLSHNEFAQLLGAVPAYWQPFVTTLASTGMRWGEATALAVKDVDLDAGQPVVRVRQAWKHTDGKGRDLGPPKTRKGQRTITLDPLTVDSLRPILEGRRRDPETGEFRQLRADDLVFVNHQGRPVHGSTFLVHVWQPALKKSGLSKKPRVHDLRHTHVSWLIAAGVPLTFIQARLGHESIATTSDVYGHLSPDAGRVSAAAIALALTQTFPQVDDHRPTLPDPLAIAGQVPDVESFHDPSPPAH